MVLQSRREYLEAIRNRYRKACRKEKSLILSEFCANCGYNRKYAIRLLRKKSPPVPNRKPGPAFLYDKDLLLVPLKRLWFATDQMCSKKLKAAIPLWLPFYEGEHEALSPKVRQKLLEMSPATIDRLLKPLRALYKKGRCSTKPGTLLKNQIPIKTHNWDVTRPGYFEADTVAHCGNSMAGDFAFSLTFTDIFSGWTENRAVWGKGSQGVLRQIRNIEERIAFPILGFDCDNGSEFLNHHLVRYFTDRPKAPVQFTRSRPYRKNDNAFVEQKNWTHVRQLLGYDRFDNAELVPLINDLYMNEWSLFTNYFCPTLKLKEKQRINSRYLKKYEPPQTPYQRLLGSHDVSPAAKRSLEAVYNSLNPFKLKRKIDDKLKAIFHIVRLPNS
ncbi:MAG: transposase [Deltaproteobacteria bacterium]|nr:transposase [Deltaproteobacteria bacterium]TLM98704.1 MAG: transposase family protein [bacterium]